MKWGLRFSKKSNFEMGFEEATNPGKTIPLVIEGKDIIGQAQTGTGKTAALEFL